MAASRLARSNAGATSLARAQGDDVGGIGDGYRIGYLGQALANSSRVDIPDPGRPNDFLFIVGRKKRLPAYQLDGKWMPSGIRGRIRFANNLIDLDANIFEAVPRKSGADPPLFVRTQCLGVEPIENNDGPVRRHRRSEDDLIAMCSTTCRRVGSIT